MPFKIYGFAKTFGIKKHGLNGDVGDYSFIAAPTYIGENVHIANHVSIIGQGECRIEDNVTIAPSVIIYTSSPDLANGSTGNKYCEGFKIKIDDVLIEKGAFIGTGAVIKQGVVIGENAIISPLTYVNEDVPSVLGGCLVYNQRELMIQKKREFLE